MTSPGSTFFAGSSFGSCSTPMVLREYVKDPGHYTESVGGRLQPNRHTPSQYELVHLFLKNKKKLAWSPT